jgi:DNA mismatch repair protein MutL
VRSFALINAIEEAYQTLIMTGKYPACVLRLQIPPRTVDVNMHPTKAEVRFSDEKRAYNAVYFAVMNALQQNHLIYEFQMPAPPAPAAGAPQRPGRDWYAPVAGMDDNTPAPLIPQTVAPAAPQPVQSETAVQIPVTEQPKEDTKLPEPEPPLTDSPAEIPQQIPVQQKQPEPMQPKQREQIPAPAVTEALRAFPELTRQSAAPAVLPEEPEARNEAISAIQCAPIRAVGELFENYVLCEAGDQFVMIDKHAAHERILFERFRRRECRDRQSLLTPVRVLMTADEITALQEQQETLAGCGFSFDFSESPVVQLTGVPLSCADLDLDALVPELAESCRMERAEPDRHMLDDKFHELACKAAIKAGTHNTLAELQALAEEVWGREEIRHCPHGRPVLFLLSKYYIERQFKRIQD